MNKVKIKKSDLHKTNISPSSSKRLLDRLGSWADSNFLSAFNFGSSCCAIDLMTKKHSKELENEIIVEPDQSDLLIISGPVNYSQVELLKYVYDQMLSPKWVIAYGACACSGGPYDTYNIHKNIEEFIKVDVKILGCPPTESAFIQGLKELKELIKTS